MNRLWPLKVIFLINVLALIVFLGLFFFVPIYTDINVRMNFTQLDRAGVINEQALKQFHPSYGLTEDNIRNTVPRYSARDALLKEKRNALFGICLASFNILVSGGVWIYLRKGYRGDEGNTIS